MKIDVTLADLAAPRLEAGCNPIATAIRRALGDVRRHGTASAFVDRDTGTVAVACLVWRAVPLPDVARRALTMIHNGQPVKPFEFHLPDELHLPVVEPTEHASNLEAAAAS